jgi:cytochrome c-type biogenesis protein CcmF
MNDYTILTQSDQAGLRLVFSVNPELPAGTFKLQAEQKEVIPDYIIMKAIEFPYINLLWGGTLIMIFGFILSIIQRAKDKRSVYA